MLHAADGRTRFRPLRKNRRSRADWLIGMNLTRLYTLVARESGVSDVLSVGRVQTPTFAIVVNRDKEIADFVPVPWWLVQALLEKDGVRFSSTWKAAVQYCDDEKRCVNKQAANAVGQLCQQQKGATVLNGFWVHQDGKFCYCKRALMQRYPAGYGAVTDFNGV